MFVLLLLIAFIGPSNSGGVNLTIYYEALCSDAAAFIVNQVFPTYEDLGSFMNIDLIPYGKAIQNQNDDGQWEFMCQHGPSECIQNKIHGCVLHTNKSFESKLLFVKCVMGSRSPTKAAPECCRRHGFNYDEIKNCSDSELGDNYLAEYGNRTHSLEPALSSVPAVFFNDLFNQSLQERASRDLKGVVCQFLGGDDAEEPEGRRVASCDRATTRQRL